MTDREWRIQTLVDTFGLHRDDVQQAMDLLERSSEGLIGFFLVAYLAPQYAPYRDSVSFIDLFKYLLEVMEGVEKEVLLVETREAVERALEFSTRALSAVLSDVPLLVASLQAYEQRKAEGEGGDVHSD